MARMNASNCATARGDVIGARLEHAREPGGAFVLGVQLAPASGGLEPHIREVELVRHARRALGDSRLIREQRGGQHLAGGSGEVLTLGRDVAEQNVRIDLDLLFAGIGSGRRSAARDAGCEQPQRSTRHGVNIPESEVHACCVVHVSRGRAGRSLLVIAG